MRVDRWQGSVRPSCGQDYGGGAGGAPGCDRRQAHSHFSHCFEDSTRHRDIRGIGSVLKT